MSKTKNQKTALPKPPDPQIGDANYYDKVFKECWRNPSTELLTTFFQLPPGKFKSVPVEFQRTRERKTDFIGQWISAGQPNTILHFEVHGKNERRLADRQLDTAGLINWHYPAPKWDLIQVALLLCKQRPTLPTEVVKRDFTYRFRLFWIKDFHYQDLLKTGNLDLVLLAPLAGFGGKKPEDVFVEVVNEARKLAKTDLDFDRFAEQLHIISNLHNLQQIFSNVMLNISSLIKEERDPFFKRGQKIGIAQGKLEGKLEGQLEGELKGLSEKSIEVMVNLIQKSDHDDAFIAGIVGVGANTVAEVRGIIQQHPTSFWARLKNLELKIQPNHALSFSSL